MSVTEKERRQFIEKRRQGSTVWQLIHLCGSLRLAMLELITLPIACAIATVCESKFNTQIAQAYVYKAPWFIFWLGVLCLNLFCVTLTRWPWKRKHLGFVITHYGIIILLIGAMVGQKMGFEANVTLHEGGAPTKQLIINRTILQVNSPDGGTYKIPFNVDASPPTVAKPRTVSLPGSDLRLVVDNYTEKLAEVSEIVDSPIPNTGPGVALELSSGMMAQTVPVNLVRMPETASSSEFFGRAHIAFLDKLPDRSNAKPPADAVHETQMVFAKFQPVITNQSGKASGFKIALIMDGTAPEVVVESPTHQQQVFELRSVLGKPLSLPGDLTQIVIKNYWADMEMADGKPVSKSDTPNNPAILVTLSNDGTGQKEKPLLEIAPNGDTGIAYQMSRAGVIQTKGTAARGDRFPLGWADWKALVKSVYPNAMLRNHVEPVTGSAANAEELIPGIHARLLDPNNREAQAPASWIPSGQGIELHTGDKTVFVGFGLEVYNLDFAIQLLKFSVPHDEGTDTPSDFRSNVQFTDATGSKLESLIHMNHPASFPAGLWRVVLGRMYKFSQAQWNPRDPAETTLQVLHDPGWPLKWSGSLLICLGIAIMFYFKPTK